MRNNSRVIRAALGGGDGAGSRVAIATVTARTPVSAVEWTYTFTFANGTTAMGYNGLEKDGIIVGAPGSLGVTVAEDGTVNGGACVVQPIGVGAIVVVVWDGSSWMFSAPNSAQ